jgi:hypothetical protein
MKTLGRDELIEEEFSGEAAIGRGALEGFDAVKRGAMIGSKSLWKEESA